MLTLDETSQLQVIIILERAGLRYGKFSGLQVAFDVECSEKFLLDLLDTEASREEFPLQIGPRKFSDFRLPTGPRVEVSSETKTRFPFSIPKLLGSAGAIGSTWLLSYRPMKLWVTKDIQLTGYDVYLDNAQGHRHIQILPDAHGKLKFKRLTFNLGI